MKVILIVGSREEYVQVEVIKGLVRMGAELITSEPLNQIKSRVDGVNFDSDVGSDSIPINQPHYTDEEIVEHSKDADYVFVLWNKYSTRNHIDPGGRMYLVDKINQPDKTIVIDGSEWSISGWGDPGFVNNGIQLWTDKDRYEKGQPWIWHHMRDRAKWYFKRETFPEDVYEHNIIPFPYPCRIEDRMQDRINSLKKNLFFNCILGHTHTGLRGEALDLCNRLRLEDKFKDSIFTGTPGHRIPRTDYLDLTVRSKMVVDAWGGGSNCTVRRNEVVMNSTAIIGQKWLIVVPNDYTDGENIINWETVDELEEKIHYYYDNQDKLIEIGENGYQHALKYHTTEKRMQYIFDIVNNKIKWS